MRLSLSPVLLTTVWLWNFPFRALQLPLLQKNQDHIVVSALYVMRLNVYFEYNRQCKTHNRSCTSCTVVENLWTHLTFTWGSPRKSQRTSLKKPLNLWFIFIEVESCLCKNILGLVLRVGCSLLLNPTLKPSPRLACTKCCHVGIHVILGI